MRAAALPAFIGRMRSLLLAIVLLLTMAPAPAPPRSPTSTAARSGCRRWTGRRRSASRRPWSTARGRRRSGWRWRRPTAAGSSPRATCPGGCSRFSWFKVWEPDGTSTVEGPLNAPSGWATYVYPLGFDLTAGRQPHGLRLLEQRLLLPADLRAGDLRPAGDQQLARPDRRLRRGRPDPVRQPRDRALGHDGQRAGPRPPRTGRPSRRGSTSSGTGFELRRTDVAANGAARCARARAVEHRHADGRQDRRGCRPKASISRPRSPSTASCRRTGSPRTSRCRLTRRASPGRTARASRWRERRRPPPTRASSPRRRS